MARQTFTASQVLTAAQMTTLQTNDFNQTVSTKTASYTLVAADAGTKIVMNSASATTITVNTSLFAAGDTLSILNIGSGVCTITAGTATVSTSASLALSLNAGGTLYFSSSSVSVFEANGNANSGLVFITGGALSTATTNFQGCFTSQFRNYRVVIDSFSVSAATWTYFRYLSGATPNATGNYNSAGTGFSSNSSTSTRVAAGATEGYLTYTDTTSLATSMQFDISTPLPAQRTFLQGTAISFQTAFDWSSPNFFILQNQSTAFDGFQICTLSTPTLTGNVSIYGYRQA